MPILMHHMCISSNYVSSAMLRLTNLEIRNVMAVKTQTNPDQIAMKGKKIIIETS
jgi:hypothetical protein